jgi:small subunit ribosomal protein S3
MQEDVKLRNAIRAKYSEAAISLIEIDRQVKELTVTLYTARPGIVIGRGGQRVDEMRLYLEGLVGKRIRLNIQEVRQPELDAYLVARSIAEQIERRVAYRRAMKQAIFRTIQSGAKGIKVSCAGRLGNAEIARRQTSLQGQVPLHTLRADIDYGFTEAHTTLGCIGIKVWIYKGQILPEAKESKAEEKTTAEGIERAPAVPNAFSAALEAKAEEPVAEPEAKPTKTRAKKVESATALVEGTEERSVKTSAKRAKVEDTATEEIKEEAKTASKSKTASTTAKTRKKAVEAEAEAEVKPSAKQKKEEEDAAA